MPLIQARMTGLQLTADQLWIPYATLGGVCSAFELAAALCGALVLSDFEYEILDHVLWALETFG